MKRRTIPVLLALLAAPLLAGCVVETPQEATDAPEDAGDPPATTTPTGTTPTPTPDPEPEPVAPSPSGPDQAQGQGQGQVQTVNQNQNVTVIVNGTQVQVPATPPAATSPTPASPTPATPTAPPPDAPPADPACDAPGETLRYDCWPREGSHVSYHLTVADSWDTGSKSGEANVTWRFTDGDWRAQCAGNYTVTEQGVSETQGFGRAITLQTPPHWPLFNDRQVTVGEINEGWYMWECDIRHDAIRVGEPTYAVAPVEGEATPVRVHVGTWNEGDEDHETRWDPNTGLVLSWQYQRGDQVTQGRLVDTDAPLARP